MRDAECGCGIHADAGCGMRLTARRAVEIYQIMNRNVKRVFFGGSFCGLNMVFAKARLRVAKNHVFYGGGKNHFLLPIADTCLTLHLCSLSNM